MRPVRAALVAFAAVTLAGSTIACQKPNLNETEGGYEEFATPDAVADTGQIAPHEGPVPSDAGGGDGEGMEH